jgi:hypothetical protein
MKNLSNMNSLKNQRGLTMLSWVAVMAIASFCGLFAFNVVPMYAENTYVVAGLKQLADSGTTFDDMTDAEIKKKLTTFYSLNNVRSEGPQHIVIDRSSKNFIVKVDYELRANLFYNIDIVTSFKNHLDSARKSECCKPRDTK